MHMLTLSAAEAISVERTDRLNDVVKGMIRLSMGIHIQELREKDRFFLLGMDKSFRSVLVDTVNQ